MDLRGFALLPLRVSVAATQATLGLGQLASPNGPISREGGYASRLAQLFAGDGPLEQLLAEEGILEKLLAPGETLDQLVSLGVTFDAIVPRLEALGHAIPTLNSAVIELGGAVEPLGQLAGRLLGGRRRPTAVPMTALGPDAD